MASVRLKELRKSFGDVDVVRGIDLEIADGEFVVFVGASGCGKSTLLRLIAGLEAPSSGDIWIGDRCVTDVPPAERGVSMVFQSYALYPHMTARENIAFGLKLARRSVETIAARVQRVASLLQIDDLLERRPRELSGGQRQRVAIARAIVREPQVYLFDEPLSNLDAGLRMQTRLEIARMHETLRTTTVYVTHDQVEAMTLADRIVLLHQGRVEQVGTPIELYDRPANLYVAGFLGTPAMNFAQVEVRAGTVRLESGVEFSSPWPGYTGRATLGIRPEHISRCEHSELWRGIVRRVEELGEMRIVHVEIDANTTLIMRDVSWPAPMRGQTLHLDVDAQRMHLFDERGERMERMRR